MRLVLLIAVLAAGSVLSSCGGEDVTYSDPQSKRSPHSAGNRPPAKQAATVSGTVTETMNSAGYTYVHVDTGSEKVWAASREFPVQVGERVSFSPDMPMQDFQAASLKRSFELIYFCSAVEVAGTRYGAPPSVGRVEPPKDKVPEKLAAPPSKEKVTFDFSGLERPEGGKTVAEIFAERTALSGKAVTIRGIIVKYTPNIMGKNWLHVRDGTGAAGTDDLTVTTAAKLKAGDRVVIKGKLAVNKDFGAGYKYEVIVEEATVQVEPVSQD